MNIKRLKHLIEYTSELFIYYFLFIIGIVLFKHKKIYLFSERGDEARDNAYHLFTFFRKEHPEINAYYVIRKNSPDIKKIEGYGHIINYRSLKHYLYFIAADYKISTHIMGCSPHMYFYSAYRRFVPIIGKKIFLQHGIIKANLESLYSENTDLDLFICGAKPEYNFIKKYFHYDNKIVKYTGLARYDELSSFETKNQILIMPTWRLYLKFCPYSDLVKSEYLKYWNSLLNNDILIKKLNENNLQLIFYPHYELQKYINLFSSKSESIIIASFNEFDVQKLLKESKMLITDYSSVYFDMAYMCKPCIYYQFDQKEFYSQHYSKGYFDDYKMGFGPVCEQESMVVSSIINYINNGFKVEDMYQKRIDTFFEKRDTCNCQRIYNAISEL